MSSAGIRLDELITKAVDQVFVEHSELCQFQDGARQRMLGRARAHAAVLGEAMEREESSCSEQHDVDPSDPYRKYKS